jgi:2-dehydro-3-deoxyphosphogluconate aldolase/(4S)-4-hydroxy-2-oxoglutarate aldolase
VTDLDDLTRTGVVAVLRGVAPDAVVPTAEALLEGGVDALEVTMDAADGPRALRALADALGDDATIGAGTVLDAETARAAIAAGAEFVVAPTFDPETVATCNRYGAPVAPGVATPTEALRAYEAGADLVKLFPASALGPDYLASLSGPLDQIPVMPTGGVGPDNAAAFFEAGAVAVGAGGALIDAAAIERGDFGMMTENAEAMVEIARQYR